jgi:hypothetical protein
MIESKNNEVKSFLDGIMMISTEEYNSVIKIRELIFNIYPNVNEKMMYGGIVFSLKEEMFSGLFVNKNHITIEFSKGFLMEDPDSNLEGKGKYRRHLKILNEEDILNKNVAFFIRQAM